MAGWLDGSMRRWLHGWINGWMDDGEWRMVNGG